jgi:hypothetical protein
MENEIKLKFNPDGIRRNELLRILLEENLSSDAKVIMICAKLFQPCEDDPDPGDELGILFSIACPEVTREEKIKLLSSLEEYVLKNINLPLNGKIHEKYRYYIDDSDCSVILTGLDNTRGRSVL